MKFIIVLHEYGAPTHYHALKYLAEQNGYKVKYFTFQTILSGRLYKRLKYCIRHPLQSLSEILFLCTLPIVKKKKIVIGIAPFNNNLPLLMWLMKKHEVYYHTSYSCWDGSRYSHAPQNDVILRKWKYFTHYYVHHIFAVSEWTKKGLVNNGYANEENISVVNHSFTKLVEVDVNRKKAQNFICVSLLIESKGIPQLLEYFAQHPNANITLVGKGELEEKVKEYSKNFSNILYKGYIKGSENIIPIYKENSFLILNSQRTTNWEELFGMVIIEGMACGCVPITTDHPGPKEIIENGVDGIICEEGRISEGINYALNMPNEVYSKMKYAALKKGRGYYYKNVAKKWDSIL